MFSRTYLDRTYVVGQHLLMLRTRARLTQSELGVLLGVHRRSIQKWECGEAYPKAESLCALLAVYCERGNFTLGREREEAEGLWQQVSQHAPQPLPRFDDAWFAGLQDQQEGRYGMRERAVGSTYLHGKVALSIDFSLPRAPRRVAR